MGRLADTLRLPEDRWGWGRELPRQQALGDTVAGPSSGAIAAQPLHLFQDHLQPLAVDELHGVVTRPLLLADAVDRDDVGMVQPGRCLCFALKALQVQGPAR